MRNYVFGKIAREKILYSHFLVTLHLHFSSPLSPSSCPILSHPVSSCSCLILSHPVPYYPILSNPVPSSLARARAPCVYAAIILLLSSTMHVSKYFPPKGESQKIFGVGRGGLKNFSVSGGVSKSFWCQGWGGGGRSGEKGWPGSYFIYYFHVSAW